jgi:hypothetical protein
MSLAFILDIEGKDVVREILPLWSTGYQLIPVLQDMCQAIVEVVDW